MHTLARITGGAALIAAPVTFVASELLYGNGPEDPAQGLARLQDNQGLWQAANLLGLLAAALFIPAIVALAALPGRGRGRRWTAVGAALGAFGVAGYAAHTGVFVVIGQMGAQSADRDAMVALLNAIDGNPVMGVLLALLLTLYLGLVLLSVGAWRARRIPWWSAAAVLAAVVLASVPVADGNGDYVAELLVIIGLGGAGLQVLRVSPAPETKTNPAAAPA